MSGEETMKQYIESTFQKQMKGGKSKMDISEYTKATGSFLKAEDVMAKPEAQFVITEGVELIPAEKSKFGNERLHLYGEYDKEIKTFDCSKTNARAIAKELGSDTEKWIGARLKLELYKTKTSDGNLVDALNIKQVLKKQLFTG